MNGTLPLPPDSFRVVLLGKQATEVLVATGENCLSLPSIEIPKNTRVAEECNSATAKRWGITSYSLCTRNIRAAADEAKPIRYIVMEACHTGTKVPPAMAWIPLRSVLPASFSNPDDFTLLTEWIADTPKPGSTRGFFAQPQSLRTILPWVEMQTAPLGLCPTGEFRQLNCGPQFSLIRFATGNSAVWFKAVGEPNLRELPITLALTKLFPSYLPRLLGAREDWNAWLTLEAAGSHLSETSGFDAWTTAAAALSQLQIASLGQALHLIDAGCRDMRACRLRQRLTPFLEAAAELMDLQTKPAPEPVSREQLRTLGAQFEDALAVLENIDIPNALGHLDLSPGNLLVRGNSCVFLDWAEAFVGHPFLTIAYLIEYLRRNPARQSREGEILDAYTSAWRLYFEEKSVNAALSVAPMLAAFAYAVSIDVSQYPIQPDTAKLLRSLTRRMKRDADIFTSGKSLCIS